jgi:hypothetical protein
MNVLVENKFSEQVVVSRSRKAVSGKNCGAFIQRTLQISDFMSQIVLNIESRLQFLATPQIDLVQKKRPDPENDILSGRVSFISRNYIEMKMKAIRAYP